MSAPKVITVAVTGLNATDSPAPGVPVIRAIRDAFGDRVRIVGLAYDTLDPGNFLPGLADHVYIMPYPSQGSEVLITRLLAIHDEVAIDVLIPTLDAELPSIIKAVDRLHEAGIRTFLPDEDMLRLRDKVRLHELDAKFGIRVPKGVVISDPADIARLDQELEFPVMVKGQFYEAYIAYSPMDVHAHFEKLRAKWGVPIIVQRYVPGEEYDVVLVGDGEGGLVGSVAMRKMQLTDKGKAWGGVTISDAKLDQYVRHAVAALKWRGPCEMEVMKSASGYHLIEINPRFPAWVYLSVGARRNLPAAVVRLALGEAVEAMPPASPGVMFLRYAYDQICDMEEYAALTTVGQLHRDRSEGDPS